MARHLTITEPTALAEPGARCSTAVAAVGAGLVALLVAFAALLALTTAPPPDARSTVLTGSTPTGAAPTPPAYPLETVHVESEPEAAPPSLLRQAA